MQDKETNFYSQAHLLVAAIRIYEHLNSRPPTLDDLGRTLHPAAKACSNQCV